VSENCAKHLFERAERYCGMCGNAYCDDCLVQPFPRKPPYCKQCAMVVAGIRSTAGARPARSPKEIKALHKAQAKAAAAPVESDPVSARQSRRLRKTETPAAPTSSGLIIAPDVVPPGLASTVAPARTRRIWRAAG